MFASSQYPMPARLDSPARACACCCEDEGHWCEESRRLTQAVLLPQGRPGAWLLLLTGSCVYVVVETVLLRLA